MGGRITSVWMPESLDNVVKALSLLIRKNGGKESYGSALKVLAWVGIESIRRLKPEALEIILRDVSPRFDEFSRRAVVAAVLELSEALKGRVRASSESATQAGPYREEAAPS